MGVELEVAMPQRRRLWSKGGEKWEMVGKESEVAMYKNGKWWPK